MASVHKRGKSKYWYGSFRMPDGKQVLRSTKCTKKAEALDVARDWEKAARTHAKESQIRKVFEDIHERLHGVRMRSDTVREFFLRWLGGREKDLALSTAQIYRRTGERFLEYLGARADKPIAELTVSDLTGFQSEEASRTTPASARNRLKNIKPWVLDAFREGLLQDNIVARMPRTQGKGGDRVKRRPFTLEEVRKLLDNASPEWQGIILAGIYTGQRLGDIARLKWSQIDLLKGEVSISTGKTGRQQIIPLAGQWKEWLMDAAPDRPGGAVFPDASAAVEKASGRTMTLSNQFREIMVAAGLAEKRDHSKRAKGRDTARKMSPLSFHCLRYTATTMLKAAGVPEAIARDIIGHESAAISRNYTVIDEATKAEALKKLPDRI